MNWNAVEIFSLCVGIVKYEEVKKLKIQFLAGNTYFYARLWTLIVLHQFSILKCHQTQGHN